MKFGDLVGTDEHGNKYYQNKYYFLGNNYSYHVLCVTAIIDKLVMPSSYVLCITSVTDKLVMQIYVSLLLLTN